MNRTRQAVRPLFRYNGAPFWVCFLAWMVLGAQSRVLAQSNELVFKHLSADNGLSHKNVHALLQDSRGFVWFGTKNGLNLYDGNTLQAVAMPQAGLDIRTLAEDAEGNIWVGTYDNGIVCIQPLTGLTTVYNSQNTPALTTNTISAIRTDRQGRVWVATFGGGLLCHTPKNRGFIAYRHAAHTPNSLPSDNILTIQEDREGHLWLGTFGGGLCKFESDEGIFTSYLADNTADIYAIEEDKNGQLWLGTYGLGLFRFDKQTGGTVVFPAATIGGPGSNYIRSIQQDAAGLLWIGTEKGGGLSCFDPERQLFYSYKHNPAKPGSLSSDNLNALFLDRMGVLWIGTEGGGVAYFDTQNAIFKIYRSGMEDVPSFTTGAVTALYEDHERILWIGGTRTDGTVLYAHDRTTGAYTAHQLPINQELVGFNHTITAIAEDNQGDIWVGTAENGLYRYNRQRKKFRVYATPETGLGSNGIEAIYKDRSGIMWVGTYEGGLSRIDPVRDAIKTYRHDVRNAASLAGNTVKAIYEDAKGNLWVGTKENGLSVRWAGTDRFTSYRTVRGSAKSLAGNSVRAIAETGGQLWIGTDAGICRFDPRAQSFTRVNVRNGLPENDVCALLPDNQGNLWVSTFSKGITRFNPKTFRFRQFTVAEGLYSNEFQQWSAHRNRAGELFFGGDKHFIGFLPNQLVDRNSTAPVYITSFTLFDKKKEFTTPLYALSSIELEYKDNFFEFEFAFLHFADGEKNAYAYMMEGVDKDWKQVGNRRLASYTNLDPGQYVFRVKAADKSGTWSGKEAVIRIVIHPAWYQTWWFRIAAVVSVLGSLLLYYRGRIRFLQRQKQKLEQQVQERTAELVQKNEEIEAQKNSIEDKNYRLVEANELIEQINEELRTINNDLEYRVEQRTHQLKVVNENLIKSNQELDMFIYRASHDIKGPLASLSGLCKVAGMDVQDSKALDYFSLLDKTCDKANHTLVRILKMYDIRNTEIYSETLALPAMIQEYAAGLKDIPAYQNIMFEQHGPSASEVFSDRSLAQIVLFNLVENAFRYHCGRSDSYVRVNVLEDTTSVHIRVHDNGIGIPENLQGKLFTMFFRGTVETSGTGLGLYLARLAVERLGGSVSLRTDFGSETVFEAVIPKMPPVADGLSLMAPAEERHAEGHVA